jgi:hypothetical protein
MEMNDNTIFGEIESPDCPNSQNGDFCNRFDKIGLFPPAAALKGKDIHITGDSALPMYKIKGDSSWGGKTVLNRNKFIGFKSNTLTGMKNAIFGSSAYQPDYTPMLEFYDTTF